MPGAQRKPDTKARSAPGERHTVPIALVSQVVQIVKRWQVDAAELLSGVGLDEKVLEDPFRRIPVADYAFPEPEYHARFAHVAHNSRFGQPVNRIWFDRAILDLPITTADPVSVQLARLQCERALEDLGFAGGFAGRVRRLITDDEDDRFGTVELLAAHLDLSPRTLRRRLAAEGASFSALVDEGRRDKALRLLTSSRLSIEHVARRLGYTTASSFVRAFHRWTGKTPVQYRRGSGAP